MIYKSKLEFIPVLTREVKIFLKSFLNFGFCSTAYNDSFS